MGETEWALRLYRLERTFWEKWLLAWAKGGSIDERDPARMRPRCPECLGYMLTPLISIGSAWKLM